MRPLSASSMQLFSQCPRRWQFEYLEGHRSPSGKFAEIGTIAHSITEQMLRGQISHPSMHPRLVEIEDAKERAAIIDYAVSKVEKRPYLASTEYEFNCEIAAGVFVRGFIDAIYAYPDGTIEIEDHKTNRTKETAEEWAAKIQPRLYSMIARRFLFPHAPRIRFSIGYAILGGEVSWQTDPEWDDETVAKIIETAKAMSRDSHEEVVGEHCRYCLRTGTCGSYQNTMGGLATSIIPALRAESAAERLSRLKGLKNLVEEEIDSAKDELMRQIQAEGPVTSGGKIWSISTKSTRKAPLFSELWAAMMGPEGYDYDGAEAIFRHGDDIFSVRLGGLEVLVKDGGEASTRARSVIQREESEELTSAPVDKIARKTPKTAPKTRKPG